ncbi:MAG: YdcF family protein, partial [Schwartzia sp.]|nr:YdcF family protein [Schwartzia sp. (in: firmicutes)]
MIAFLKFGVTFVLPPGIFMLILFWLSWKLRRREKEIARLLFAVALVFYAISTPFVASALMRNLEAAHLPPEAPSGDVIVLLGGGSTKDTPDLDGAGGLSEGSSARLLAAARLYHRLHIPVLFTGGKVFEDSASEADIARRMLLGLGVPGRDIILEKDSKTTGENAKYTAAMLKERGFSRPLLVTSAFHMKRSVLNFEKQGVPVTPFPAGYRANSKARELHYIWFGPEASALDDSVCVMREELRCFVTRM